MSDSQYSFQIINLIENIEKSFSEFLFEKQIEYPNLSNKKLEEWDFENYLDKNKILPLNLEKFPALIDSIPNLSNVKESDNHQLKLIKFYGTIQNVFENQLYISAKYDSNNKKYLPNKYFENNSNVIKIEDDNLGNKSGIDILGDRLRLELIPVIGINEYFDKIYDLKTDNHQKIIVYDYSNKFTKINQNILVIGVAYEKNDVIIIHCWKIIENYEKMKICKDSYSLINITQNKNIYREKLKNILSNAFITYEYIITTI
jgi:predicted HNH restriction endonuclease